MTVCVRVCVRACVYKRNSVILQQVENRSRCPFNSIPPFLIVDHPLFAVRMTERGQ